MGANARDVVIAERGLDRFLMRHRRAGRRRAALGRLVDLRRIGGGTACLHLDLAAKARVRGSARDLRLVLGVDIDVGSALGPGVVVALLV
ncbi:MAG: hypothetical protein ABI467_05565 [Kofleriaceae bacterium]